VGFLDDAKKKLGDAVDKHGDKISDGLDKAGHAIDERTGSKHTDGINSGVGKAKDTLDGLDGKRDDMPPRDNPSQPAKSGREPVEDVRSATNARDAGR